MSPPPSPAEVGRQAAASRQTEARGPQGRGREEAPPRLSVLDRRDLEARSLQRRSRVLLALAGLVLAGAFGVVAGAQGLVASQQLRLDQARQQLSTEVAAEQGLQLRKAQLESPARVLREAEHQLHMVTPATVTYLTPVRLGAANAASARPSAP